MNGNKNIHLDLGNERGSVFLQFLLSCMIFFLCLFFELDLSRWAYQNHVALFVINEVGRQAATWNTTEGSSTGAAGIKMKIQRLSGELGLQICKGYTSADIINCPEIQICPMSSATTSGCPTNQTSSIGKANEYFAVMIRHPTAIILNLIPETLTAAALLRYEPNPASAQASRVNPGPGNSTISIPSY